MILKIVHLCFKKHDLLTFGQQVLLIIWCAAKNLQLEEAARNASER
jgi:hypothetical protein